MSSWGTSLLPDRQFDSIPATLPVTVQISVPVVKAKTVLSLTTKLISGAEVMDLQTVSLESHPKIGLVIQPASGLSL